MISNSSKYALRAIIFLHANTCNKKKVVVKNIAEILNIPEAYIAKLLQKLSRNHIISSSRGPKGGFYLSEENKEKSIMSVIEIIDGDKKINACILSSNNCDSENPCPFHKNIFKAKSEIITFFTDTKIKDITEELYPYINYN